MEYGILAALMALWVGIDGWRRGLRGSLLVWLLATGLLWVVALPIYWATRPLYPGEVREGRAPLAGPAWTRRDLDPRDGDHERAGPARCS